jgi:hypothetical protein
MNKVEVGGGDGRVVVCCLPFVPALIVFFFCLTNFSLVFSVHAFKNTFHVLSAKTNKSRNDMCLLFSVYFWKVFCSCCLSRLFFVMLESSERRFSLRLSFFFYLFCYLSVTFFISILCCCSSGKGRASV